VANEQSTPDAATPMRRRAATPIDATARAHKRRLLKRLGVSVVALDPLLAERITSWSIARAILDRSTNNRTRVSAFNAEQKAMAVLEERIAALNLDGRQSDLESLAEQGKAIRERREQAGS